MQDFLDGCASGVWAAGRFGRKKGPRWGPLFGGLDLPWLSFRPLDRRHIAGATVGFLELFLVLQGALDLL